MRVLGQKVGLTVLLVGVSAYGFLRIGNHFASRAAEVTPLALETALDARVPFLPVFVLAYFLYYPMLLLPLAAVQKPRDFYRAIGAFALMQLVAGFAFVLFPSRVIRPSFVPEGFTGDLLHFIYQVDTGWNAFPSLHVGHSTLVALICWTYRRSLFPMAAVGAVLIAASTVLIKQHYVVDIPGGVLLAWICFSATQLGREKIAGEAAGLALGTPIEATVHAEASVRRSSIAE